MNTKEPKDWQRRPSAEYRYFLYDPEGDGMVYFRTVDARDRQAALAIAAYLDDGEWGEDVEFLSAGELTHFAQVDRQMRPEDEDLDEEKCDGEGVLWPDDMDWRGNYTMAPVGTLLDKETK